MEALKSFLTGKVLVKVGDLTKENVDAIVNAASSSGVVYGSTEILSDGDGSCKGRRHY